MIIEDRKPIGYLTGDRVQGAGSVFGASSEIFDSTTVLFDDTVALFGGSDRTNSGYIPKVSLIKDTKPR